MTRIIEIENLRNIKKLRFEIPDRGVWLLTAGNGAGKTSLLACIRRIGHSNAFPVHFPSSLQSVRLDDHSKGKVTYWINNQSVEYAYRGERWTPRPRSNSNLFEKLGYSSVMYIGATADRITPRPEDFNPRNVKTAGNGIISAVNAIFETTKFSGLKTINLARGTGNEAFVLALGGNPQNYHSEKHFSLGELCVLKLLKLVQEASNNSLIIVDELEMALHPKAQVNLLKYLEDQSLVKSLTVIFSTHSVTLLKTVNRRNIIFLEKQDSGEVKVINGCFPTYAIGNIASQEESLPDIMIYVEDLFARDIAMAFFAKFSDEAIPEPTARPTIKVVPVGPFDSVVSFLDRNRSVLPVHVTQKAILDEDVSSETIKQWEKNSNHGQLQKFKKLCANVSYLPFTPEIGIVSFIFENRAAFEREIRKKYKDNQIRLSELMSDYDHRLDGAEARRQAKRVCDNLIIYLCERTQKGIESVREDICDLFAILSWEQYKPDFMKLFRPMIR